MSRSIGVDIRRALIDAMKILHNQGLLNLRGGNASALFRVSDSGAIFVYITPSGVPKHRLELDDIAVMNLDGYVYEGSPSSEYRMHLEIYKNRSDVRAVVHAHNPLSVFAYTRGIEIDYSLLGVEAEYYLGGCVEGVGEYRPGSVELAIAVADALRKCDVVIIKKHGAVAVGTSEDPVDAIYEAVDKLEVLEDISFVSILDRVLALLGR